MALDGIDRTAQKWGKAAVAAGFTILPNHLIGINEFLPDERRLSPTEQLVLIQVLLAWWSPERLPFPSKSTIARRTGLSPRQIQRALSSLEEKQFLRRISRFSDTRGRLSNVFNLSGTVEAVQRAAAEQPDAFKRRREVT